MSLAAVGSGTVEGAHPSVSLEKIKFPVCRNSACGRRHDPRLRCTNSLVEALPRADRVEPSPAVKPRPVAPERVPEPVLDAKVLDAPSNAQSSNTVSSNARVRSSRGSYNAYQRAYMQTRRAIEAGRASRWPV